MWVFCLFILFCFSNYWKADLNSVILRIVKGRKRETGFFGDTSNLKRSNFES